MASSPLAMLEWKPGDSSYASPSEDFFAFISGESSAWSPNQHGLYDPSSPRMVESDAKPPVHLETLDDLLRCNDANEQLYKAEINPQSRANEQDQYLLAQPVTIEPEHLTPSYLNTSHQVMPHTDLDMARFDNIFADTTSVYPDDGLDGLPRQHFDYHYPENSVGSFIEPEWQMSESILRSDRWQLDAIAALVSQSNTEDKMNSYNSGSSSNQQAVSIDAAPACDGDQHDDTGSTTGSLPVPQSGGTQQGSLELPGEGSAASPAEHEAERLARADGRPIMKFSGKRIAMQTEDFSQYYEPLPETPRSWGVWPGVDGPLFKYTKYGEWQAKLKFDEDQLRYYMEERKKAGRPLTVWVQNQPSQCKKRFPKEKVGKCRWKNCQDPGFTISKGDFQVTFDENPEFTGSRYDPFHNAGYMHLFCFEKCFDLQEPVVKLSLRPDCRDFKRESKNPFAITRDGEHYYEGYWKWQAVDKLAYKSYMAQNNSGNGAPPKRREIAREDRLCARLTKMKLTKATAARATMRQKRSQDSKERNGVDTSVSIDKHLGDLELRRQLQEKVHKVRTRKGAAEANVQTSRSVDQENVDDNITVAQSQDSASSRPVALSKSKLLKRRREQDNDEEDLPSKRQRADSSSPGPDQRRASLTADASHDTCDSIAGRVSANRRISAALQMFETERLVKERPYAVERVLKACRVNPKQIGELLKKRPERKYWFSV